MKYNIRMIKDDMGDEGYLIYKRKYFIFEFPIMISTLGTYGMPFFPTKEEAIKFIEDRL